MATVRLRAVLANATGSVKVVVTFRSIGAPSQHDAALSRAAGITQGLTFQSLPIAGVLATGVQVVTVAAGTTTDKWRRSMWPASWL